MPCRWQVAVLSPCVHVVVVHCLRCVCLSCSYRFARGVCGMYACRMACRVACCRRYGSVMPYDVMLSACVLPVLRLLALPRACVVLPQRVACVSVMLPVVTLMGFACGGHVARLAPSHRLRIGGLPWTCCCHRRDAAAVILSARQDAGRIVPSYLRYCSVLTSCFCAISQIASAFVVKKSFIALPFRRHGCLLR